jgi:hypothetical protein
MLGPLFVNGIDFAVGAGISTVDLLISNCSIEGTSFAGIKMTSGAGGFWINLVVTGNQFMPDGASYAIYVDGVGGNIGNLHLTGNCSYASGFSTPFIYLANVTGVAITGNGHVGHSTFLTMGAGVTFLDTPTYIGRDARLVPISGGVKLEVRNTSSDTWLEATRYTNP